ERLAEVEVVIDTARRKLQRTGHQARSRGDWQAARGEVRRILTRSGWVEATGEVLVQINVPREDLQIRQRVVALGMLSRPRRAMNPGEFDWQQYLRQERVLASISVRSSENIQIVESRVATGLDR